MTIQIFPKALLWVVLILAVAAAIGSWSTATVWPIAVITAVAVLVCQRLRRLFAKF
jgi:hypothetical protein